MRRSTHNPKTFGFTSCSDVFAKLERELARLHSAKNLEETADHASNAAVTAWHLPEWAWAALKKGNHINHGVDWANIGSFQKWLTTEGCTQRQHCQVLANSFKSLGHGDGSRRPGSYTGDGGKKRNSNIHASTSVGAHARIIDNRYAFSQVFR